MADNSAVLLGPGSSGYSGYSGAAGSAGSSFPQVVYGDEVDFLGSPTDVTYNVTASNHGWIEEAGWVVTEFDMDGGSLSDQPFVRFGITGDTDKYLAAEQTTLLTAQYKRERYVTMLADDGETSFTAGMTVAASVSGGGTPVYKGKPFWVIRELAD